MMPANKVQAWLQTALTHHRAGRLTEAEKLYAQARTAAPRNFDALHLSGVVAQQQGRAQDAAQWLRGALKLNPTHAVCEMRLGIACAMLADLSGAEQHLRAAVARDPRLAEAWCHLGMLLRRIGRRDEARSAYAKAIGVKPDYAEAHDRLGALVSELDGFPASVPHFRRAVELQPGHAGAWSNLGAALAQSGNPRDAMTCLDRALGLDPNHELALTARALVLQETYRLREAAAGYQDVIARHPKHTEARSARLLTLHYLDDVPRQDLFAEHVSFGANFAEPLARTWPNDRDPARRLRVGFLSPDLRAHSVAYFLEPLLARLDRAGFEVFLYHDHARVDAMSARLQALADQWHPVAGLPHDVLETRMRADALDVLVDLAGHTGHNRLPLLARRLAPVQVTYLGYPDTTGLRTMDYRLVDAVTDPTGVADAFHTEKLVRFAPTAWSYSPPRETPEVPPLPSSDGRPVTFGCFNNFAKVSDATVRAWSRLLQQVPGSRLLLKGHGLDEPQLAAELTTRFARQGVSADRVELLGRTPGIAAHLAAYGRVDIALDTFPYHGTTTTCEALWMGRPVVTLLGDRHAARVGASVLQAVGRPEWIAQDWDGYVRIAAELATDSAKLHAASATLRGAMQASPLMDHPGQAARFGAALRGCWQSWCGS